MTFSSPPKRTQQQNDRNVNITALLHLNNSTKWFVLLAIEFPRDSNISIGLQGEGIGNAKKISHNMNEA